jgi:hypothetical protein
MKTDVVTAALLQKASQSLAAARAAVAESREELKASRDVLELAVTAVNREDGDSVAIALGKFGKTMEALDVRQNSVDGALTRAGDSVQSALAHLAEHAAP